jgi:hypothetical protein
MQDNNGARPVVYQPTANDGKKSLDVWININYTS